MKITINIILIFSLIISLPNYAQTSPIKKGLYLLINVYSNKAAGMENDNSLSENPIANEITREWLIELLADGSYKLTNQEGGLVLQVKDQSKKPDAPIIQGNWQGNNSQKWNISFLVNGHLLLQNKNSGYYMTVLKGHIIQAHLLNKKYQEWLLQSVDQ